MAVLIAARVPLASWDEFRANVPIETLQFLICRRLRIPVPLALLVGSSVTDQHLRYPPSSAAPVDRFRRQTGQVTIPSKCHPNAPHPRSANRRRGNPPWLRVGGPRARREKASKPQSGERKRTPCKDVERRAGSERRRKRSMKLQSTVLPRRRPLERRANREFAKGRARERGKRGIRMDGRV